MKVAEVFCSNIAIQHLKSAIMLVKTHVTNVEDTLDNTVNNEILSQCFERSFTSVKIYRSPHERCSKVLVEFLNQVYCQF